MGRGLSRGGQRRDARTRVSTIMAAQNEAGTGPRVTVVGSCVMDFSLSVPRLPRVGETVVAHGVRVSHGGKGANQAIFLARLGAAVQLISCVGEDDFGRSFRAALASESVGSDFVAADPAAPTGLGVPMIVSGDANAIVVAPGASLRLDSAGVRRAAPWIASSQALLAQLEVPFEAILEAVGIARAAGVPVFLNAAPAVEGAAALCPAADVLIVNEEEAQALSGKPMRDDMESTVAAARALQRLGPEAVIVTLGRRGALLLLAGGGDPPRLVPGFKVAAVDPTGAGDAFCAGLVSARCRGAGWPAAVELGNACGALAATGWGAVTGLADAAGAAMLVRTGERWSG
jgi:ribokinase